MQLRGMVGGRADVCGLETTLQEVSEAMLTAQTGSVGVIEGRALVGIITERDILARSGRGRRYCHRVRSQIG